MRSMGQRMNAKAQYVTTLIPGSVSITAIGQPKPAFRAILYEGIKPIRKIMASIIIKESGEPCGVSCMSNNLHCHHLYLSQISIKARIGKARLQRWLSFTMMQDS